MCGIVGILDLNGRGRVSEEVLLRMIGIIRHRGPDESGIYVDNHIGLGHARLSIIGLKGGAQPIENEDGTLWIIYNGEAFNYIELSYSESLMHQIFRNYKKCRDIKEIALQN